MAPGFYSHDDWHLVHTHFSTWTLHRTWTQFTTLASRPDLWTLSSIRIEVEVEAPRGELTYQFRLEKLGLSSLENRFHYLAIAFVSKCLYRVYDVDPFVYVRINTHHTDTIKFHYNFGRTDCFKYNVYTRFPVQFQSLPRHIRDKLTISFSSFLSNCKLHFKQSSWLGDS